MGTSSEVGCTVRPFKCCRDYLPPAEAPIPATFYPSSPRSRSDWSLECSGESPAAVRAGKTFPQPGIKLWSIPGDRLGPGPAAPSRLCWDRNTAPGGPACGRGWPPTVCRSAVTLQGPSGQRGQTGLARKVGVGRPPPPPFSREALWFPFAPSGGGAVRGFHSPFPTRTVPHHAGRGPGGPRAPPKAKTHLLPGSPFPSSNSVRGSCWPEEAPCRRPGPSEACITGTSSLSLPSRGPMTRGPCPNTVSWLLPCMSWAHSSFHGLPSLLLAGVARPYRGL